VTGFFRDPEAWEALRQRVIVPLVQAREPSGTVRCWVAACSSGEEAYSLAMLLVEESERASKRLNIKIFATDTAERALSSARNGVYPGGIESEISPERLRRFFEKDEGVYRVRQDLRERVVFAPQNVLRDPPFSRLDIVTCRNLLIYLEPEVQLRVFALMHFGLREGGTLFLGSSETVPVSAGAFEPIDKKARIFRRVGPTWHGGMDFRLPRVVLREGERQPPNVNSSLSPSVAHLTARTLIALHVPAAVTVDQRGHVVYYHGDTKPYLGQPSGEPTQDLIALSNDQVRGAVRTALQRAMASGAVAVVPDGWVSDPEGQRHRIVVTASPLAPEEASDLFVVSFLEELSSADTNTDGSNEGRQSGELQRLRDELQSAIEELQASSEEHKAAAEEAMSMNEELQSSNEELETSKEELQSLNEELSTVNLQLHAKIDELQKTSGDLRSLLASTDIAVILLDSQFRIRRYTPAAKNLFELIGSDVGRPLSDLAKKFVDPDLLDDARSALDLLVPAEREVRSDDGSWYTRRVLPYRAPDDRIEGVVITFVDISDRRRAEDLAAPEASDLQAMNSLQNVSNLLTSAKDTQGVLREILDASLDLHGTDWGAVHLYDRASNLLKMAVRRGGGDALAAASEGLDFVYSNAPAVRALREQSSLAVANLERELAPSPFRDQCLASGVRALLCIPLIARNGEHFGALTVYFREQRRPDERSTRITEFLVRQAADIIERMRIEDERARMLRSEQLARRALDDAATMKDEFLAALSHELRTPLSAILLWGKLIRDAAIGSDELKQGMDAILSSAEAQARLIDDLLDTSRSAAGKLRLELAETDLVELVRSVVEQNEPAARARQLAVEVELKPSAGVVMADETRLRQVVWNLLSNAVKFTPENGKIRVLLDRVDDDVLLRVSDTGTGISPDFLPNVFDRFRQYEASITRRHGGLGLGLAISKQLVEMHGGTIRAESAGLGQGATFTVTMPLRALRHRNLGRAAAHDSLLKAAVLNGARILLVEDDAETQAAIAALLRHAGAQVITVASGDEALAAYQDFQPQILLSDLGLPDIDGYALLRRIRAVEQAQRLPEVPAVALSAYTREEDREKAAAAGYRAHLAKPVDADELIGALARLN
jgi:two-component system CheB/CheR fusion protein